jgi:hypothetical protein
MQTVSTIGLDIAKSLFQVHGIDAAGQVVIRRQLKRRYLLAFFEKLPPCLAATSSRLLGPRSISGSVATLAAMRRARQPLARRCDLR